MRFQQFAQLLAVVCMYALIVTGCYRPPYNEFRPYNPTAKNTASGAIAGAVIGTGVGAIVGSVGTSALIGTGVGALTGLGVSLYKTSRTHLIKELQREDILYIQYGDTTTLVVPTDRYFLFNSPRLNDLCYMGLVNIVKLIRCYVHTPIYVAAFTDSVGSREHKDKLTQARAEAMLTFLWANGISAQQLHAEGYGDRYDVGQNALIRGSAYNRRLEIQWFNAPGLKGSPMRAVMK